MMGKILAVLFPLLVACQSAQAGPSNTTSPAPNPPDAQAQSLTPAGAEGSAPAEALEEERTAISGAFAAQAFDESWRGARETRLRTAFSELKGNVSLESVECRQTLCKLIVRTGRGRTTPIRRAITRAFDDDDGFLMEHSFVVYSSEDRSQSTIYVSRNHYTLPDKNGVVAEIPRKSGNQ